MSEGEHCSHAELHVPQTSTADANDTHPPRLEILENRQPLLPAEKSTHKYSNDYLFQDEADSLKCHIYGDCPVQGDGWLRGYPIYFRARGSSWSFILSCDPEIEPSGLREGQQPGFFIDDDYGGYALWDDYGSDFDASYMPYEDAEAIIRNCAKRFLKEMNDRNA